MPDQCSFCHKITPPAQLTPMSESQWVCDDCWDRCEAEDIAAEYKTQGASMRDYGTELEQEQQDHQETQKQLNQALSREARLRVQLQKCREDLAKFNGGAS